MNNPLKVEVPFTEEKIRKIFSENKIVDVAFYKLSGYLREMRCTLDTDLIRSYTGDSGETINLEQEAKTVPGLIRVYSIDSKGWRSFFVENLIEIKGVNAS